MCVKIDGVLVVFCLIDVDFVVCDVVLVGISCDFKVKDFVFLIVVFVSEIDFDLKVCMECLLCVLIVSFGDIIEVCVVVIVSFVGDLGFDVCVVLNFLVMKIFKVVFEIGVDENVVKML